MSRFSELPQTPTLTDLAAAAGGRLHGANRHFTGVGVDTRRLAEGDVFFALHSDRADGHDHVDSAVDAGAAAVVVERLMDAPVAQIQVADTWRALQQAGAEWRNRFAGPVVGITGSNGKTTVRRLTAAVLAQSLGPVLATSGNFNNELGVPLTLLRLRARHVSAVVEMGANHTGEIEMLARMAQPTIGVITNAGDAHLEGFGSRDGVARAKGELYEQLAGDAIAVINADDAYAGQWRATASHCRQLCFALQDASADVSARAVQMTAQGSRFVLVAPTGEAPVTLALPGEHNIYNALAAAAAGVAADVPVAGIAAGLAQVAPEAGRLALLPAHCGARLVDDSYNANPESLNVALDWLASQHGPRWLVLGDMAELGDAADAAHRNAGVRARDKGIERLWAIGEKCRLAVDAFGVGGQWFEDHGQLGDALREALVTNAAQPPVVLVKGSRSARMDRVVCMLAADTPVGGAPC